MNVYMGLWLNSIQCITVECEVARPWTGNSWHNVIDPSDDCSSSSRSTCISSNSSPSSGRRKLHEPAARLAEGPQRSQHGHRAGRAPRADDDQLALGARERHVDAPPVRQQLAGVAFCIAAHLCAAKLSFVYDTLGNCCLCAAACHLQACMQSGFFTWDAKTAFTRDVPVQTAGAIAAAYQTERLRLGFWCRAMQWILSKPSSKQASQQVRAGGPDQGDEDGGLVAPLILVHRQGLQAGPAALAAAPLQQRYLHTCNYSATRGWASLGFITCA